MVTPRYVVTSPDHARQVIRHVAGAGWQVRAGFQPQPGNSAQQVVCYGVVSDPAIAKMVVQAAARGAGVVAVVDATAAWGQTLVDDLARLGPVRRWDGTPVEQQKLTQLRPDQQALLERLSCGQTIAAAAAAEYMSLRTANRRVAAVRDLFDVATTREAVEVYQRLRGSR